MLLWMVLSSLTPVVAPASRVADIVDPGVVVDLSGVWLFHAGDNPAFARPALDDLGWSERQLPSDETRLGLRWNGHGWYRLHFTAGHEAVSDDVMLTLGPAREVVEVYVNGSLVAQRGRFGARPVGGTRVTPLVAHLPAGLLEAGDNVLAVRVYDPGWTGGLPAGPLLLGSPRLVREATDVASWGSLGLRIPLALIGVCVALAQLLISRRRQTSKENLWIAGAALMLAVVHLDGTGVLQVTLENLELAARLPMVAGLLAVLCLGSYFAARHGDTRAGHVSLGQGVLAVVSATLLLLPDKAVFLVASPVLLLAGLVTTLYAAHVLLQAARRQEHGALPVFASLVVLALLIIYDGLFASGQDFWPPVSMVGAIGVVAVVSIVGARQTVMEHEQALVRSLLLDQQLERQRRLGILEGTALSITAPDDFLQQAVQEAARELEVRRCSLVLLRDGELEIAASVGLPKHTNKNRIPKEGSIAGWVFSHGTAVTAGNVPPELQNLRRPGSYRTEAFISQPVQADGGVLGVLSVSDRNDGADFSPSAEAAVAAVAHKLALVLTRLGPAQASGAPAPVAELQGAS